MFFGLIACSILPACSSLERITRNILLACSGLERFPRLFRKIPSINAGLWPSFQIPNLLSMGLFAPVAQVWAILAPIVPLVSDAGNALIGDILESIAGHVPGPIRSGNESLTAPKILLRILLPTWFGNRKSQKARKLS